MLKEILGGQAIAVVEEACSGTRPATLIKSAAFSPIMIVGAFVFPVVIVSMIDALTARNP